MAAQFEGAVVTDSGRSLIAASEGTATAIEFTGMGTGSGVYTAAEALPDALKVMTALKNEVQSFPISGLRKYNDDTALIKSVLSNEDLVTAYNWNEVGMFARLEGSGNTPILFAIAVIPEDGGDEIPARSPTTLLNVSQSFYLKTDEADSITIEVNHGVCELLEDAGLNSDLITDETETLVAAINEVKAHISDVEWMINNNRYYAAVVDDDDAALSDDDGAIIVGDWKYQIM